MADNARERGHGQGHHDKPEVVDSSEDSNESVGRESFDPHQKGRIRVNQVSRPPSSHITRVDEEPSGSDGRKSGARLVETVDRGVGPTPLPPPLPPSSGPEPRVPSYFSFHPFPEARNGGLLEAYGLPYPYSHYPYTINAPLPLNPSTLEGRYHWPPASPFHQHLRGLTSSPSQAEISLLGMRSPMLPGDNTVSQLASRLHYEQLQRNYYHPLSSRRFSPASLPGLPLGTSPFFGEYAPPSLSGRSFFSDIPPTPGSGSITLPGSLESSRLTSPRPSIVGGKSRKRALSHSPISDYLDIQSLTRSSEGSLQLASFLQQSSRSSSAASGSYGHLSAASVGTVSPGHPMLPSNPYLRAGSMAPSGFFYPPVHPLIGRQPPPVGPMLPPGIQVSHAVPKFEPQSQISTTTKEHGSSSIVSSTMDNTGEMHKVKVKKEMGSLHIASVDPDDDDDNFGERGSHIPQEGEPDFIETNCHWVDCNREFETQDDLVKHINQDHIQSNKKSFVCKWQECSREEKPFKAQYMLVVHMRRHTGEKPHRCTFEGCAKAYSRLENLKTHLRSHTGEKPYMCEFPGCTKAFSNASDRAKHQNRTHSNAKPYVCKAIGCTKRYTDPSSLRKHVKTVHGADFYANKKHKGDASCQVKKEDPDGDSECYDANRRTEEGIGVSGSSVQVSSNSRQSQDTIGSAPSSNSQPSPDRSPEVNVTCGLGPDHGHLIDDRVSSEIGNIIGIGEEEEDIIIPESNEAEIPGSSALLTRRNQINAGQVMQNRLKGRINSKAESISPLPHIPGRSNHIGSGVTQVSITELPNQGSQTKLSPQNKRITDIIGEQQGTWRETSNTLLPVSRRESNSSTLSSYMSSMRSMGSTFSSRRSSGASQFSSRRSSEISARLSIANSPYEYDITGNLPNSVSRRSSGESSTNIGNVSAMMQKTNLGSQTNLVVPPIAGSVPTSVGASGNNRNCPGFGNSLGNRCYNERLARYFCSRREIDGARTSTPCCTPLPHEIPDREIRRASDPVRTQDPSFNSLKSLQRYHSLNAMKPLPTPPNMHSLQCKSGTANGNNTDTNDIGGSNNTFHSSQSSIATDAGLNENGMKSKVTEAELEEKMLEDSEDLIIPDDMRRFLNERYRGDCSGQEFHVEGNSHRLAGLQEFGEIDINFDPCEIEPEGTTDIFSSPCSNNNNNNICLPEQTTRDPSLMAGNLQLQIGFADLRQGPLTAGSSPGTAFDPVNINASQRRNCGHTTNSNGPWSNLNGCSENGNQSAQEVIPKYSGTTQQINGSIQRQFHTHQHHHHPHLQQQQANPALSDPNASQPSVFQSGKNTTNNCVLVGKSSVGHGTVTGSGMGPYNTTSLVHGTEVPLSDINQSRVPWKAGTGSATYLSQQNLMQHQLQQHYQQQQAALDSSTPCFMPHPPPHRPNFHQHQYHNHCTVLSSYPPLGGFSPLPPPGEKPPIQRQKRSSPQVQVPHISQSQIPANAKAANRGQTLVKQQQQQQQMVSNRNPLVSPYPNLNMSQPQENFAPKLYSNHSTLPQGPCPPLHLHPQHCPYPPTHYPSVEPIQNSMPRPGVLSNHFQCNNHYTSMNHIPGQLPSPNNVHGQNHTVCQVNSQSINSVHPSQIQNIPHHHPTMIPNTPCAGQALPQYGRNNTYSPMEMSPGCNQVTSSTDCKETTAPPIEDFMDNLTSISTENLMDNIHSISQENIAYSPAPISMRSASQNSGRFNALMNTSNMVINDMSSVLTQLAEENRYLNMRP